MVKEIENELLLSELDGHHTGFINQAILEFQKQDLTQEDAKAMLRKFVKVIIE